MSEVHTHTHTHTHIELTVRFFSETSIPASFCFCETGIGPLQGIDSS